MAFYQISNIIPHLKNPHKCKSKQVTCRSGWEISFVIKYLDVNENIIEWTSEDTVIRYYNPVDNQYHRYFLDFTFKAKTKAGNIKTFWVEIKPYSQTQMPNVNGKRKTKRLMEEISTYYKNQAKWSAARKLVEEQKLLGQDVEFLVITEKDCPFFLKG